MPEPIVSAGNGMTPQLSLTGLLTRCVNGWPQSRIDEAHALVPGSGDNQLGVRQPAAGLRIRAWVQAVRSAWRRSPWNLAYRRPVIVVASVSRPAHPSHRSRSGAVAAEQFVRQDWNGG